MPSPREAAGLVEAAADADGGGVGEGRGAGLVVIVVDEAKKLLRLKASIFSGNIFFNIAGFRDQTYNDFSLVDLVDKIFWKGI